MEAPERASGEYEAVNRIPRTGISKPPRERPAWLVLALSLAGVLLLAWVLFGGRGFEAEESLNAPGIKEVVVSDQNTAYPSSDVLRFSERPPVVYVYVSVDGLPAEGDLEARVERSARGSLLSRLLSTETRIQAVDEQGDQLVPSGTGSSGVLKFAVRTESGEPLPAGNYNVRLYLSGKSGGISARKSFVILD